MLVNSALEHAAAPLLLVDDRLAQLDALAADVDVARALDEGADVAVAFAAEGTVGVAVAAGIPGRPLPAAARARSLSSPCDLLECGRPNSRRFDSKGYFKTRQAQSIAGSARGAVTARRTVVFRPFNLDHRRRRSDVRGCLLRRQFPLHAFRQ